MIREAVAKIRVGFIDCSDRAVQRMCAGCAGNDGYSYRSAVQTRSVELKCDGCADRFGFDTSAESAGRDAERVLWRAASAVLAADDPDSAGAAGLRCTRLL